jgi:hypothetical protein
MLPKIANQPLPNARASVPNVPNAPQAGAVNQPQINNLHAVMAHEPRQNVNVVNPPVDVRPDNAPHVNAYCQAHGNRNGRAGSNHHLKTISVPKYTGSADAKTPYDFIVEMDRFKAISRSTEEFMLHEIVPAALEGAAYPWYRSDVSIVPFHTWEEFKLKFWREFQTLGYAEQMRRALERRTQGPTEPLTMFIRVIVDFYERLEMPVTEDEIIKRVLRQAHPEYLETLHGRPIHSLIELKQLAFQAQELIKQKRLYEPPPTNLPIEPSHEWTPIGYQRGILQPEKSINSVINSNINNPQVHFASVDLFRYHHAAAE